MFTEIILRNVGLKYLQWHANCIKNTHIITINTVKFGIKLSIKPPRESRTRTHLWVLSHHGAHSADVFRDLTPCRFVVWQPRYGETCRLHFQYWRCYVQRFTVRFRRRERIMWVGSKNGAKQNLPTTHLHNWPIFSHQSLRRLTGFNFQNVGTNTGSKLRYYLRQQNLLHILTTSLSAVTNTQSKPNLPQLRKQQNEIFCCL